MRITRVFIILGMALLFGLYASLSHGTCDNFGEFFRYGGFLDLGARHRVMAKLLLERATKFPRDPRLFFELADFLADQEHQLGEMIIAALKDPNLTYVGLEAFETPEGVVERLRFRVPVFRFEPFARAIGLAPGQRSPDTEFVLLPPPGYFLNPWPGSPLGERGWIVEQPFLIARTAVTNRVFKKMNTWKRMLMGLIFIPLRPVRQINWSQSQDFCSQNQLRLPLGEEWEFAAQAGTREAYWGEAWFFTHKITLVNHRESGFRQPLGVSNLPPNAFGLFEALGNIWEWVDGLDKNGYTARGGSFNAWAESCEPQSEYRLEEDIGFKSSGFRPVYVPQP